MRNGYLIFFLVSAFFFSCSNDLKEVQMINADRETPDESMEGVTMIVTDNGMERAIINTPLIYSYGTRQGRKEFPKGLAVDIFNQLGEKETFISSKKGHFSDQTHMLELEDSVVMINFKTWDTLQTEYMVWKQDSAIIVAPYESHIYGNSGEFWGKNFRSNENFTKSSWKNFRGKYFYNQTDTL